MAFLSWRGAWGRWRWPDPAGPGARVGLFAPAHRFDREELDRGAAVLRSWGFEPVIPKKLQPGRRYLAGTDRQRLDIITRLMEDDSIKALLAVRGGFGCQRLLPDLAERWPHWPAKPVFGFSDLTAFHLARLAVDGVLGFHSPMLVSLSKNLAAVRADTRSQKDLKEALLHGGREGRWDFSEKDVWRPGRAEGPILGGNLTLLTALLASPWLPDFQGAILMLEEVDEPPYRLDRLLTILRQSPIWAKASALVFGRFARCGPPAEVRRLIKEAAGDFPGRPVLINAPFSHLSRNRLFPLGAAGVLAARATPHPLR